MKVLSCSDLHLGNYQMFNKPTDHFGIGSRLQERINAVYTLFDYGKEHNIKHYVFNGDIFDKRQKENIRVVDYIVNQTVDAFSKTPQGSVLYLNIGNHDEQSKHLSPNSLSLFSNVHIPYHKIVIINSLAQVEELSDNTNLLFIPYTEDIIESKKAINNALGSLSSNTTVFAHLGVVGSVNGRWGTSLDGNYSLDDLGWNNSKVNNIVLGHYHTRQVLKEGSNKKAWYQGNLLPMNFNDVEKDGVGSPRGFDIIDTKTGETEFINLCEEPFNYAKFNILEYGNIPKSTDELSSMITNGYNKVTLDDSKDISEELLDGLNSTPSVTVTVKPKITQEQNDIEIKENTPITDIIRQYCNNKQYSDEVLKCALMYIKKAGDM